MQRVVTVGRFGTKTANAGRFDQPVWAVKVYEGRPRQRDGVKTWRLVETVESIPTRSGRQPSQRFMDEARAYAESVGLPFRPHVTYGDIVEPID